MTADFRELVKKGPVTAAVIGFECQNIHTNILRPQPVKSRLLFRIRAIPIPITTIGMRLPPIVTFMDPCFRACRTNPKVTFEIAARFFESLLRK